MEQSKALFIHLRAEAVKLIINTFSCENNKQKFALKKTKIDK